jgi:peptidoglycan-associated lipoprotein
MKTKAVIVILGALLLFTGCGVNKDYVAQQISDSEARTGSQLKAVSDKTDTNASEITKLRSLSAQLSEKTDMAINEAKGFETYQVIWQGEINFGFDSYDVNANAEQVLIEAGEKMEQHPSSVVEVAGYTDRTGSSKYNLLLGEKRANSAKRFLADRFGISLYRMFVISYGEDKPLVMDNEQQESSKNRRVAIKIWGNL